MSNADTPTTKKHAGGAASELHETVEKRIKNWSDQKMAKAYCILNCWETPKSLGLKRKLSQNEIHDIFDLFKTPKKIWLKIWNDDRKKWGETE